MAFHRRHAGGTACKQVGVGQVPAEQYSEPRHHPAGTNARETDGGRAPSGPCAATCRQAPRDRGSARSVKGSVQCPSSRHRWRAPALAQVQRG